MGAGRRDRGAGRPPQVGEERSEGWAERCQGRAEGRCGMCSQSPTEHMQIRPVCMQMRPSVCR